MDGPKKKQQKLEWEDRDFSTREVRGCLHHKSCARKDGGFSEEEAHVSVRWLKKAVEKFCEPGSGTFENHHMDLKLSALKLCNEICGALGRSKPLKRLSFVDAVLNQSKVIEETTLMRGEMQAEELAAKTEIMQKHEGRNCTRPHACVSHEDKDAAATRAEAEIRASRNGEKKLVALRFKTKKTNAKRKLSAVQKFADKKGDMVSDNAITTAAKMHNIHLDCLEWEKELHCHKKISWIHNNIRSILSWLSIRLARSYEHKREESCARIENMEVGAFDTG